MCRFYKAIEVRFGDLDALGHVNNARYLTYMEQARIGYFAHLRLRRLRDPDVSFILADAHIAFLRPLFLDDKVRIGVRVVRLGNKSFTMHYRFEDADGKIVFATGETVQVCYNYKQQCTIPLPPAWRQRIAEFESIPAFAQGAYR